MLDGVMPVLVKRSEKFLETFLDSVSVRGVLVESVGEASHRHLLALKKNQKNDSTITFKLKINLHLM